MVNQALLIVGHWLALLIGLVLSVFWAVDDAMRHLMAQLHIAAGLQSVILVLVAVALIIVIIRVFGGLFRVLLTVFLVLLLISLIVHH